MENLSFGLIVLILRLISASISILILVSKKPEKKTRENLYLNVSKFWVLILNEDKNLVWSRVCKNLVSQITNAALGQNLINIFSSIKMKNDEQEQDNKQAGAELGQAQS